MTSLRRRITAAYTLYALGFVIFFALVTIFAVEGIEGHLVDARLRQAALWAVPRHAAGLPIEMPAGISFHHGRDIPHALRGFPDGVHDLHIEGQGLHVLAGSDHGRPYVVVDHQSDYDKVELVVYSMLGSCLLGFLLFSYFLAGHVARRVIDPLTALSAAVASGNQLPNIPDPSELAALAKAFDERTDSLRRALERERYFAGDVSHELRTPLTIILGAVEVLQARHSCDIDAAPLGRIYRAAVEGSELVQVLLLLARAPASDNWAPVELDAVVSREVERHTVLASQKKIRLHQDGTLPMVVHAPVELCSAAIGNLIRNACMYTEAGEVAVRMEQGQIVVEDTGGGLPDAVIAAIESRTPLPSAGSAGTGLGLSLTMRICDHLGARLGYEATASGSRFTIAFAAA
ncbi:sensor histidine kinase [Pseudoduganella sp. UC29_71]|uniref:sensor histidine kinase n=1 Tax=Pseudoduganella sp. UC29_71 TaxID=3350174 RepID=UPI00366FB4F9